MKILLVNKFLYDRGGAEAYVERLARRLVEEGHDVAFLGSLPEDASKSWSSLSTAPVFEVDAHDYHGLSGVKERARAAGGVLWSRSAAVSMNHALSAFEPDVVHVHNYSHQLSSSIMWVLLRRQVRVVYTAHDYKLICPAYHAKRLGKDCFACSRHVSPLLLRDKCLHDDRAWSSVAAAEAVLTRSAGLAPKSIVSPSSYLARHFRESWLTPESTVTHIPNPVEATESTWGGGAAYLLYVGRLSSEKGLSAIIRSCGATGTPLVIAGDGPERAELESMVSRNNFDVTFLGHVSQDKILPYREDCVAQIVPSVWPENAPLAALEAAAMGVPLLLANRGGLPELIEAGAHATLLDEFSESSLRASLLGLRDWSPSKKDEGLSRFKALHSWDRHMASLTRVYDGME